MQRVAWYAASMVAVGIVLWIRAETRPIGAFQAVALALSLVGVAVTYTVARREGLSPIPWTLLAVAIGPMAWVVLAARARPAGGTGGVVLGGLAIGFGLLIDALVLGFVRIVPA